MGSITSSPAMQVQNILKGGGGSDTLTGGFGDSLRGESGNDTLIAGSALTKEINGGTGNDTLNLDLITGRIDLRGTFGAAIKDVEIIDLSVATQTPWCSTRKA